MRSKDFHNQLWWAANTAHLTIADLARWFNRPYHTVQRWLEGSTPYEAYRKEVWYRLELLVEAVNMRMLPLPSSIKQHERPVNLRGIYSVVSRQSHRISESNTTG